MTKIYFWWHFFLLASFYFQLNCFRKQLKTCFFISKYLMRIANTIIKWFVFLLIKKKQTGRNLERSFYRPVYKFLLLGNQSLTIFCICLTLLCLEMRFGNEVLDRVCKICNSASVSIYFKNTRKNIYFSYFFMWPKSINLRVCSTSDQNSYSINI